jgi:hypothetical protein
MSANEFITIVAGLPRSGTSMMMRMLEAGGIPALIDHERTPDEDNPNGYYEFEAVKQTKADQSWLQDAPGKVVKMVYRLLYDLPAEPSYRVIFMRRKLEEVLASQRKMLERNGRATAAGQDDQVAKLFLSELAKFDAWIAQQPNFQVLNVDYNQVLADPCRQVARINEFCGGQLNEEAMATVVDPQLYRNRAAVAG